MDEAVIARRARPAALLLACLLAGGACAQTLQDPTRPPASSGAWTAGPVASSAGPQLQTILVAREPGGRHLAVIDGQTVRLGETFQGARVARIADNEVELVRGKERQVLRLYAQDSSSGMTPVRPHARRQGP